MVLGVVRIVVAAYTKSPNLIAAGVAMAAGGVIQMLSPQSPGLRQSHAIISASIYAEDKA
jgi:predicted phage tail protein